MFRRFFDEGLAQSSYLLACDRTRQAVVVDPRRDIDEYVAAAEAEALTITHAIETHIHADFVSGARELASLGARVISGPAADLAYTTDRDLAVVHNQHLAIGDLELTFLHTPGHTPEHISILARQPGEPDRLFTGDTLFVGAVGRPDLLGESVALALARDLYDSIYRTILALPDDVEVHPGHGAGSLCGAGIGVQPHSTIGQERRVNTLLRHSSRDAFVDAVLGDLPETPAYFARMKLINRAGPRVLGLSRGVGPPPAVPAATAAAKISSGGWLVDLRPAAAFGQAHAAGALSMSFNPKVGYWAAWILPADARIHLMMDDGQRQAAETQRQLLRVGLDSLEGSIEGGLDGWRAAGLPVGALTQLTAAGLRDRHVRGESTVLVDVRSDREWRSAHVPGALHIPLHALEARVSEIPRGRVVATMCEGGFRSSLAASLLERHGMANLVNVVGGMNAWRALGPTNT
ncbi:MAG: rhodanese-like domain-containing protein [Burkholderiales bacterium]